MLLSFATGGLLIPGGNRPGALRKCPLSSAPREPCSWEKGFLSVLNSSDKQSRDDIKLPLAHVELIG